MQVRRPLSDLPAQALSDFPAQAVTHVRRPKPLSKANCRVILRANLSKEAYRQFLRFERANVIGDNNSRVKPLFSDMVHQEPLLTARRPNLVLSDMVYHTARCCKCEKVKTRDEFSGDQTKYTGLSYICRQCESTRERERCATDPHYKIKKNLRSRFRHALKRSKDGKAVKCGHTLDMLGCSMDFFIKHIEEQFEPGMSWSNHGFSGFHIDHVIPCASFDLTDPEQQKKCFHFSNMQPMWASEKLSKGAKFV